MNDLDELRLSRDNAVEFGRQMFARTKELEARLAASEAEVVVLKAREAEMVAMADAYGAVTREEKREREEAERAEALAKEQERVIAGLLGAIEFSGWNIDDPRWKDSIAKAKALTPPQADNPKPAKGGQ